MSLDPVDWAVQRLCDDALTPSDEDFARWLAAVDAAVPLSGELTLRLVDSEESQTLNHQWRGKPRPTNVLSFGYGDMPELLGDLVFCVPLVADEAQAQAKPCLDHWAHLTIHGLLHLSGYDHELSSEAEIMEAQEIAILATLDISNPYETPHAA